MLVWGPNAEFYLQHKYQRKYENMTNIKEKYELAPGWDTTLTLVWGPNAEFDKYEKYQ